MKAFLIGFGLAWWLSSRGYLTPQQLSTITTAGQVAATNAVTAAGTAVKTLSGVPVMVAPTHWKTR